ncbi:uncharacterized protein LOC113208141 isoform X2 [Frankliniella occidentalis]|uniref:Uncharacterized protein LOC113208141 isoform X2 n=1 Tax=Frankliniella occidentalis TaxID=133901 RepID=A0A9C6U1Z9_FRAOC|nr:uncharacterized protein LOC113208141 isoform X2 [Frankliniella occidentalis]
MAPILIEMMDQREQRCPCGCPGMQFHEERDAIKIKTKEKHSSNVHEDKVFGFEVLRFQGKHYCPEKIAPIWKKDCRMWLWKCSTQDKNKPNKRVEKEPRGC